MAFYCPLGGKFALNPVVKCTPQRKDWTKPVIRMGDQTLDGNPNAAQEMTKHLTQDTIL